MKMYAVIASAIVISAGVTTSWIAKAAAVADSEEVSRLLSDAKSQAYKLSEDAATMESFTRSAKSFQGQSAAVAQITDDVNAAGRTLAKLEDAHKTASPWQATAIDRIRPLLKEIASNTDDIIKYLKANPNKLEMREYADYLEGNADTSSALAELVADFVNYGRTKARLERLSSKLELPAKAR